MRAKLLSLATFLVLAIGLVPLLAFAETGAAGLSDDQAAQLAAEAQPLVPVTLDAQDEGAFAILYEDGYLILQQGADADPGHGTVVKTWVIDSNVGSGQRPPWGSGQADEAKTLITHVVVKEKVKPYEAAYFFGQCENIDSIVGLENFDVSDATSLRYLFWGCGKLASVDLSGFETSNVASMEGMFSQCNSLRIINFGEFNTSNVTDMSDMFYGCSALGSVDLSSFNTSKVTKMGQMFSGCSSLASIDFSSFDSSGIGRDMPGASNEEKSMLGILDGCTSLKTIVIGSGFAFQNYCGPAAPGADDTYAGCWLRFSDAKSVKKNYDWNDVENQAGTWVLAENAYAILYDNGNLVFQRGPAEDAARGVVVEKWSGFEGDGSYPWSTRGSEVKAVCFEGPVMLGAAVSGSSSYGCDHWFEHCVNLEKVEGLANLCHPNSMRYMFRNCPKLAQIDVEAFGYASHDYGTDWSSLFDGCTSLVSLDLSSWDSSEVRFMDTMFAGCTSLADLDVSNFDTTNVTSMSGMFRGISATSLNLSSFNTSSVSSTSGMFQNCSNLTSLDLSNFDMSKNTYMVEMFKGCSSLSSLKLGSNFRFYQTTGASQTDGYADLPDAPTNETYTGKWRRDLNGTVSSLSALEVEQLSDVAGEWTWERTDQAPAIMDITGAVVTLEQSTFIYDGQAKWPAVQSVTLSVDVIPATGYDVSYSNNTAAGTATVTVTGKGDYTGSATTEFTIGKASLTGATIALSQTSYVYDGIAKRPEVTKVMLAGGGTVPASAYDVSYSANTNAGIAATVTVTAKENGNYEGAATATFAISKADLRDAVVVPLQMGYTYDGVEKTPAVLVTLDGVTVPSSGYVVAYDNNVNAGNEAVVEVSGQGNYDGVAQSNFAILPASINGAVVTLTPDSFVYDGTAKMPVVKVVLDGKELGGLDYAVAIPTGRVKVGTYTISVEGQHNYIGSVPASFTITAPPNPDIDITGATVTLSNNAFVYNGSEQKPTVTNVTLADGTTVVPASNYTVSYSDGRVNAGTYTVTVTAKDDSGYTGSATSTYKINKASLTGATVTLSQKSYTYDGSAKKPGVSKVALLGGTVVPSAGYTVSYASNTNAGTATVTVTGQGNYADSAKATFTISAANISSTTVTLSSTSYTYDGSAKTPSVTVKLGGNTVASSNYSTSYSSNTNAGSATVTVAGKSNLTGSVKKTFTINKANLSGATVTLSQTSYTYDGTAKKPSVTSVKLSGKTVPSSAYDVSYSNNTNVGTATAKVTGKGNYTGSASTAFSITAMLIRTGGRYSSGVHGWRFLNSVEPVELVQNPTLDMCTRVFGYSKGRKLYDKRFSGKAKGLCYGMAASAAAVAMNQPEVATWGVNRLYDVGNWNWKGYVPGLAYFHKDDIYVSAGEFAQFSHLLQCDSDIAREHAALRNNCGALAAAVYYSVNGGDQVIIGMQAGNIGHAVWPLRISADTSQKTDIVVYDCNYPGQTCTLTLYKSNGTYTNRFSYDHALHAYTSIDWDTPVKWATSKFGGKGISTQSLSSAAENEVPSYSGLLFASEPMTITANGERCEVSPEANERLDVVLPITIYDDNANESSGSDGELPAMYWTNLGDAIQMSGLESDATVGLAYDGGSVDVKAAAGSEIGVSVADDVPSGVTLAQFDGSSFSIEFATVAGEESNALETLTVEGAGVEKISAQRVGDGNVSVSGVTSLTVTNADGNVAKAENLDPSTSYTLVPQGEGDKPAIVGGKSDLATYAGKAKAAGFTDLDPNGWYLNDGGRFPDSQTLYLDYTIARGLMSGYAGTTLFGPDDQLTRGMAATIIYRMATGKTAETTNNNVSTKFSDVPKGAWYAAAVKWCADEGVVTGYSGTDKFGPEDPITREQLATIIGRYMDKDEKAGKDVSQFKDKGDISDYAKAGIAYCNANKVMTGIGDTGNFDPQGLATRCQMSKVIAVVARMAE